MESFYVARREIPGWVVSLAFFQTFESTNTYIGQAGKSFQFGLSWAWVVVSLDTMKALDQSYPTFARGIFPASCQHVQACHRLPDIS